MGCAWIQVEAGLSQKPEAADVTIWNYPTGPTPGMVSEYLGQALQRESALDPGVDGQIHLFRVFLVYNIRK